MTSLSIRVLAVSVVASLTGIAVGSPAGALPSHNHATSWQAAWTTAQHHPVPGYEAPNWSTIGFDNQTVRQVVRITSGGAVVRIRLSNRFGSTPLRVTGATIGRSSSPCRRSRAPTLRHPGQRSSPRRGERLDP